MDNLLLKYHEQRLENFLGKINAGKSFGAYKNPKKHLIDLLLNVLISRNKNYSCWSRQDLLQFRLNCLNALISKNTLDPIFVDIEKAIKLLDDNDVLGSKRALKEILENRDAIESEIQKAKAEKPRKTHPIDAFIKELVNKNPQITSTEVLNEIRNFEGGDLIDEVDQQEGYIYFKGDPAPKKGSVYGIKDRLHRIKTKI
jgi:hypothetical protein